MTEPTDQEYEKDWKLEIIDDALDEEDRIELLEILKMEDGKIGNLPFQDHGLMIYWFGNGDDHPGRFQMRMLQSAASQYFDFSKCIGYEAWTHMNTRPGQDIEEYLTTGEYDYDSNLNKNGGKSSDHYGWHYDKDEMHYSKTGEMKFPICSLIYYVAVAEDLKGGRLMFRDHKIIPKQNRLIIFSPGIIHDVECFEGERCSLIINPWNEPPETAKCLSND